MNREMRMCRILLQENIASGIFRMRLAAPEIVCEAGAGQFVSLYCREGSRLLPRPISIHRLDRESGTLELVYRVAGKGTEEFSRLKAGDEIRVLGPLGNGFPLERAAGKRVLLLGGGIGIPPMAGTADALAGERVTMVAGYRDEMFLDDCFAGAEAFYAATEDGSAGTRGNVLDAVREHGVEADVIFACGPAPMLRAVKAYALEKNIECWVSMEERMACGIGACLACVCKTSAVDEHSNVQNRRICKDGPVFLSTEVEI